MPNRFLTPTSEDVLGACEQRAADRRADLATWRLRPMRTDSDIQSLLRKEWLVRVAEARLAHRHAAAGHGCIQRPPMNVFDVLEPIRTSLASGGVALNLTVASSSQSPLMDRPTCLMKYACRVIESAVAGDHTELHATVSALPSAVRLDFVASRPLYDLDDVTCACFGVESRNLAIRMEARGNRVILEAVRPVAQLRRGGPSYVFPLAAGL